MAGVYKVVSKASVRDGPNKSDRVIGYLQKNTEVMVSEIVTNTDGLKVAKIILPSDGSNGYVKLITSRGKYLLEKIPGVVWGMSPMGNTLHPQSMAEDSGVALGESAVAGVGDPSGTATGGVPMEVKADPFESIVEKEVRTKDGGWEKRKVSVSNIGGLQYFNTFGEMIKLASKLRKADGLLWSVPHAEAKGDKEIIDERERIRGLILKVGDIWFRSNRSNCAALAQEDATSEKMDIRDMIECLYNLPRDIHKDILWCLKEYLRYKIEELQLIDDGTNATKSEEIAVLRRLFDDLSQFGGGGKRKKKSKRIKTQKKKFNKIKTHNKKSKKLKSKK